MFRAAWIFLLFCTLLQSPLASAISLSQVEGIRLSAKDISRDYEKKEIVLEGDVDFLSDDQKETLIKWAEDFAEVTMKK